MFQVGGLLLNPKTPYVSVDEKNRAHKKKNPIP
jgi:hypothetical protein